MAASNYLKRPLQSAERDLTDVRNKIRQEESNLSELKAGDIYKQPGQEGLLRNISARESKIAELRKTESLYQGLFNYVKSGDFVAGSGNARDLYNRLGEAGQAKYLGTPVKIASDRLAVDAMGQSILPSSPAAVRANEQEAAAYQAAGTPAPLPIAPPTPTPVDNVVNAEEFVNEPSSVTVGGTPNLQTGKASPLFVSGQDLYYIPSGGNTPVKISGPSELQNLASAGLIEVGGTRLPLNQAGTFLSGQTQPAPTASGTGFLENVGVTRPGPYESLLRSTQAPLLGADAEVRSAQEAIKGFEPADLGNFREQLQRKSGLDDLLDEISSVDSKIAELVGVERRLPETTLAAAQNTEITQAVLDRQRTIELEKLSRAVAPLTDLKKVLGDDLSRREKLIDDSVQLKKEADAFKLQQLGFALDFAVQNRSISADRAESMFNAAVDDFNLSVKTAEARRKEELDALKDQQKAMADFYEAQGYVIDPVTGELAPTLELSKFRKSSSGSGSGGAGAVTDEVIAWAEAVQNGLPISQVKSGLEAAVTNYIASQTNVAGPTMSGLSIGERAKAALNKISGGGLNTQTAQDLSDDIAGGATLEQLYGAYPEVSKSLIDSAYKAANP